MLYPIIYILFFIVIWWSYLGYPLFLHLNQPLYFKKEKDSIGTGTFTILVPVFNEKQFIKKKIENLLSLNYPKRQFQIIFIDGGSDDGTLKCVRGKGIKLLKANKGNKILDLNYALSFIKTKYIMITDADSLIDKSTLMRFDTILSNPKVGIVGAFSIPKNTITQENAFWKKNNLIRLLESRYFSTSSVVASCYAFKKDILTEFPKDVIADDLYATYNSLSKGLLAIYDDKTIAYELRGPTRLLEMFKHKIRKAHGDIKEILRFLNTSSNNSFWNVIFPTKFFQTLVTPLILPFFFIMSAIFLFINPILVLTLFLFSIITIIMGPEKLYDNISIFRKIELVLIINSILFLAILTYMFSVKNSRYLKVK